jgi:hypothetical protein
MLHFPVLKMTVPAFAGTVLSSFSGDSASLDFHPHSPVTVELLLLSGLFLGLLLGFRHESSPVTG